MSIDMIREVIYTIDNDEKVKLIGELKKCYAHDATESSLRKSYPTILTTYLK